MPSDEMAAVPGPYARSSLEFHQSYPPLPVRSLCATIQYVVLATSSTYGFRSKSTQPGPPGPDRQFQQTPRPGARHPHRDARDEEARSDDEGLGDPAIQIYLLVRADDVVRDQKVGWVTAREGKGGEPAGE